jgi:Protein of unknown function (DUF2911)
MTRRSVLYAGACFSFAPLLSAFRREERTRVSPHETVSVDLGSGPVTITYGRPYLKGRKVGQEVAPFDQVWRLGADEATKLTIPTAAKLGSLSLTPGSYALFAIPGAAKWTIIVNKVANQWGAFDYDQSKDVGRFDVPVKKLSSPVEEFTISLEKQGRNAATMTFAWGGESVSTTLTAA